MSELTLLKRDVTEVGSCNFCNNTTHSKVNVVSSEITNVSVRFCNNCFAELQNSKKNQQLPPQGHNYFIKNVKIKDNVESKGMWYESMKGDTFIVQRVHFKGQILGIEGISKYNMEELWIVNHGTYMGNIIVKNDSEIISEK